MENLINNRLRKFLKSKNIKQVEYCDKIGLSVATLKTIFQRDSNLNMEIILSTAENYSDLNIEWLLTGKGEMEKAKNSLKIFVPDDLPKQVGRLYRAPIYEAYPVSAGKLGLSEVRDEKPNGYAYTSMPGVTFFPVIGCSFEPLIYAGQYIGTIMLNSWERIDTEKIYFILTREERMLKRLRLDETDEGVLWCVSPNFREFKISKEEILEISHVFFHGKMI